MEYKRFVLSGSLLIGGWDRVADCPVVFDKGPAELNYQKKYKVISLERVD
jgi:hypothetical protein